MPILSVFLLFVMAFKILYSNLTLFVLEHECSWQDICNLEPLWLGRLKGEKATLTAKATCSIHRQVTSSNALENVISEPTRRNYSLTKLQDFQISICFASHCCYSVIVLEAAAQQHGITYLPGVVKECNGHGIWSWGRTSKAGAVLQQRVWLLSQQGR